MKKLRLRKTICLLTILLGFILIIIFIASGAFFFLSPSSPFWKNPNAHLFPKPELSSHNNRREEDTAKKFNFRLDTVPERHISSKLGTMSTMSRFMASLPSDKSNSNNHCNMHNCFDIYRCPFTGEHKLTIYVYPFEKFLLDGRVIDLPMSREFYEIIVNLVNGPYYVSDPNKACILVPSIDLLNLERTLEHGSLSITDLKTILSSLKFWGNSGENHLLLTLSPDSSSLLEISGAAIVATSTFPEHNRQLGFKLPWMFINPLLRKPNSHSDFVVDSHSPASASGSSQLEKYKLISLYSRKLLPKSVRTDKSILFLDYCPHDLYNYDIRCNTSGGIFNYPAVLTKIDFCLVHQLLYPSLWDVMSSGCIPVLINEQSSQLLLPFDEIIDWRKHAILINEAQLSDIVKILGKVSSERRKKLKSQIKYTFQHHLSSIETVVETLLAILKQRVFPYSPRPKPDWSSAEDELNPSSLPRSGLPILNPGIANHRLGFTTVILAYERIPSLFQVIERLKSVPSLVKILVIWNNQVQKPPAAHLWPNISMPIKVVQTDGNRLSNRFFPYDEIQTEAVFSLDDDIVMLTTDEIEFGFQTWCEFSDRIVGFPSRTHVWDNSTSKWKYESEWMNQISMVLTGAAFYHKYWHHAYFHELPAEIFGWVDSKKNCEDIAMNFLIAHSTGKSAIKVIPRKKFKCPTCSTNEMLSADTSHMRERTDCINKFSTIYGYMPLIPVEFRADPVLFKMDSLPKKMKAFNDIGSL